MEFIVAEKQGPHGLLLVIKDKNLLGKKVEERNVQLDLLSSFYKGVEKTEEEVCALIMEARDIHFTGEAAVALGVRLQLIEQSHILLVQGVPHAEVAMG